MRHANMRTGVIAGAIAAGALFAAGCAGTSRHAWPEGGWYAGPSAEALEEFLDQYAATSRFRLGRPGSITVTPDNGSVLFLRSGARSFVGSLYELDLKSGEERVLLTADSLLSGGTEELSEEEKARRERMRSSARGIASYQLSSDGTKLLVPLSGRLFVVERATGKVVELRSIAPEGAAAIDPVFSPDGTMVACARDGDLYVTDIATNTERRLTTRPGDAVTNAVAEFVAQEEMSRFHGFWWSPDSKFIAFQQNDESELETMHIMDPLRPEREPQTWRYPRAGRANAKVTLAVMPADGTAEPRWVEWDREKYPYLATVDWAKNAPLTILVQNREQTEEQLLEVDTDSASTGLTARVLLTETDDAWINLDQDVPRWLDDGSAFLWSTERNGGPQLELRGRDGSLIRAVTDVALGYRSIAHVDSGARTAVVSASPEPTESHLYRVSLDGAFAPQRITPHAGQNSATFSKDGSIGVFTHSNLNETTTWTIRGGDGSAIATIRSVAEEPKITPTTEILKLGRMEFRAAVTRPRMFDARRTYPVIVSVYGGPGVQTVIQNRDSYLLAQWMAEHGYIVVSFDGRGTPNRGRAWERVIKGNLIDVPLEDQVAALEACADAVPQMDLSRVGITGWSFGGYFSAMAAARRPDVYSCGIAGAPVSDWLDYDTHYTERYLGVPDLKADAGGPAYRVSSVLSYAKQLRRPLLIVHGTADDNVYMTHSLKLTNTLLRAGCAFDFLPLAGFTHMVAEPEVVKRLQAENMRFLGEHLRAAW